MAKNKFKQIKKRGEDFLGKYLWNKGVRYGSELTKSGEQFVVVLKNTQVLGLSEDDAYKLSFHLKMGKEGFMRIGRLKVDLEDVRAVMTEKAFTLRKAQQELDKKAKTIIQ